MLSHDKDLEILLMENKVAQSAVAPKPDDDEIDILEILVFLKSKWRFLIIFLILGVIAGGIASMWMRPAYIRTWAAR